MVNDIIMTKIIVKQVRSKIGSTERQKLTLQALGFKKLNGVVEKELTDQIMGMVRKVNHLVTYKIVETVEKPKTAAKAVEKPVEKEAVKATDDTVTAVEEKTAEQVVPAKKEAAPKKEKVASEVKATTEKTKTIKKDTAESKTEKTTGSKSEKKTE